MAGGPTQGEEILSEYQRLAGGYIWKEEITRMIRSEIAEVADIEQLLAVASTPDTCRVLARLLASKVARVNTLHELLNFAERDK